MQLPWRAEDIEMLEAISQNRNTRELFLRMAHVSRDGRLAPFLEELVRDSDLDAETAAAFTELATDSRFLSAVEEYLVGTQRLH